MPKTVESSGKKITDSPKPVKFQKISATQICVSETESIKSQTSKGKTGSGVLIPPRVRTPVQINSPLVVGDEIESPMFNIQFRDFKDVKIKKEDGKLSKIFVFIF